MDLPKTNGGGSNTMAVTSSNVTGNKKVSTKATSKRTSLEINLSYIEIKLGMHKKAVSIAQNQLQGISATATTALYTKNNDHHNNSVMH